MFAKHKQLRHVAPVVPVKEPTLLSAARYELILNWHLMHDARGFLELVRRWSPRIYSIESIITAVTAQLHDMNGSSSNTFAINSSSSSSEAKTDETKKTDAETKADAENKALMEALGELYLLNKQDALALHVYLRLGRSDVFKLVRHLDLFDSVRNKVLPLMQFNAPEAIALFIEHYERIPVNDVCVQLKDHAPLMHAYLHALFKKDSRAGSKYHPLQVELYARYEPQHLLQFLQNSNAYVLEDALRICTEHKRYRELVFILKRMGNTNDALELIIEKLGDVKQAIAFVDEHKDDKLWENLITHSLKNAEFLSKLLGFVGHAHNVDMLRLVGRIPNELAVPLLKQKLCKILSDCMLQQSVRVGCNNIFRGDVVSLTVKLNALQRRGVGVTMQMHCSLCNEPALRMAVHDFSHNDGARSKRQQKRNALCAFRCGHVFHRSCMEALPQFTPGQTPSCMRCTVAAPGMQHQHRKR
jgi:hypothetical protein